ncbi:MAG: CoA transferase [Hyphomicrobiales bacterium]|nr:CoA transferase [Hyphomicrobiales bacterium]
MVGPLQGIRVLEFAGIGPGPFAGMMLADMGADVIVVDRKTSGGKTAPVEMLDLGRNAIYNRGKRSIAIDLKSPRGAASVLRLVEQMDGLIEGFRPGVMERLGLGPDVCLKRNTRLVYGRMTGWGQSGPLASTAGHDINFVALSGALHLGRRSDGAPWVPPTLVGDMGGGAMLLALGLVSGILRARISGQGQVVDAAITEGSALLAHLLYAMRAAGGITDDPSTNPLGGAAHWYDCYECADGEYVSLGALEPQFYQLFLKTCGLDEAAFDGQYDRSRWPERKDKLRALFRTKTRDEWCAILEGTDVCFAPVLNLEEAPEHPHNTARESFMRLAGVMQPSPAPRFSATPASCPAPPPMPGEHTDAVLQEAGLSSEDIATLRDDGALE